MSTHSRGQAEVLGTILLVGLVVTASLLIMGVAMGAIGGLESQSEEEAIERAMMDIRSAATDIAIEGEATQSVYIDLPDDATVASDTTSTAIWINHTNYQGDGNNESEQLYHQSDLGTFEVEHDDVRYALEGGGIFKSENGNTRLVSPPNFGLSAYTANIPVLRLETDDLDSNPRSIALEPGEHIRPAFPDLDATYDDSNKPFDNPVMNGSIEITIEGPYYKGWSQFFEQYTDGNVTVDDENSTVTAEMESLTELMFTQEITYSKEFNTQGNAVTYEEVSQSEFLPDNQPIIENRIEEAEDEADELPQECEPSLGGDGCELSSGTYYFDDSLTIDEDLTINTSEGDVELITDGDFDLEASIEVVGDENDVEYFVAGDFRTNGEHTIKTENEANEAHRNLMHIGGDHVDIAGNVHLDVVIYSPEAHVDIGGTSTVTGAIITDELTMRGDSTIEYDSELETIDGLDLSETDTPIMYLHITENTAILDP